jgi:uracil-DNA glycosylase
MSQLSALLPQIRACRVCAEHLPLQPRPVLQVSETARILIVGHAPSTRVHDTGLPWNDASGKRLREWLQIDRDVFYDAGQIAIMATGMCYPGRGKSGDLPPRPECASLWHPQVRACLPHIGLTLLIGQYAQTYYLQQRRYKTLTATVRHWREYAPDFLPMPHPSPRNQLWLKRNPWFEVEVVPVLRARTHELLA